MIATKSRRLKTLKMSKNLERLYKERKCRECAVVMTRMDFAKILGKFTKVKIQYQSTKSPKSPKGRLNADGTSNSKYRLERNENGLVHRNNLNLVKGMSRSKKSTVNESATPKSVSNILKENNRLKESVVKDKNANYDKMSVSLKHYGIIFTSPVSVYKNENKSKISLAELLPDIDDGILPSEEWCIDYFPKNDEPKDDKVYDRIAAELEDLMNSGKPLTKPENKSEEFPSILDILNDNTTDNTKTINQSNTMEFKSNLESSDVEAMLLGKPDTSQSQLDATSMDVDNPDVSNLIADVNEFTPNPSVEPSNNLQVPGTMDELDNPHSPSILDEALQKGVEEHLPPESQNNSITTEDCKKNTTETLDNTMVNSDTSDENMKKTADDEMSTNKSDIKNNILASKAAIITQVVFKKIRNGECYKSVTCPKNLKYSVELDGQAVELAGAPKFVSSFQDLQVLLQIVNESELKSFHVLQ